MIRSLALLVIPLAVIAVIFTNLPDDHPVKEVDWKPVLATARKEAPYQVLAPTTLPDGWRATRVAWVPQGKPYLNGEASPRNLWQLGFLTPDDAFIDLNQGDVQPQDMVDQQSRAGTPDGSSVVAGRTWQRLVSPDGRTRSLVLASPDVTTVVTADLPYEALEAYASTLSNSVLQQGSLALVRCLLPLPSSLDLCLGTVEPGLADRGQLLATLPQRQ
jgi:hypothetical protein